MSWSILARAALGRDECDALLAVAVAVGFSPVRSEGPWKGPCGHELRDGRDQQRAAIDDEALARLLWGRLNHLLGAQGRGAAGLNERLRFYAYEAGQAFPPHTDGHYRSDVAQSALTLLVYLNDGFTGGETVFLDDETTVAPSTGAALLFPHARWHEGRPVRSGRKVVLRTDVMFCR